MSDLGLELDPHQRPPRRKPRRGLFSAIAVLLSLAVLAGGGYVAYTVGVSALKDRLRGPEDYTGAGAGQVLVEVKDGDAAIAIARTLRSKGVVKSEDAFIDAARQEPRSVGIQVGFYQLKRQMSAQSALEVLLDPENRMRDVLTVPEGLRVDQVVDLLVDKTAFTRRQFERVLASPTRLGLPSYARGDPEGYLFPATYELPPNATPRTILAAMVTRYEAAAADLDLVAKSKALGYSAPDVLTVASIVQAEGKLDRDFPKIAQVIYNRLEIDKPLQLDTTIVYIFRTRGKLTTSAEQRQSRSPYNTYRRAGLPPTPINAPGEAAIEAALNPTKGPWIYFVTTDPSNGAMSYAVSYKGHLRNVEKFREYCRSNNC